MSLSKSRLKKAINAVAENEPAVARMIEQVGYPAARIRPKGYPTLLRALVGQQVSVAAANSVWAKLIDFLGEDWSPEQLLEASLKELRACGLSKQKQAYARSLSEYLSAGHLDLAQLPQDDEAAIKCLTEVKGIGQWTAEVYLLFAEGRPDIWPAGDLAIQKGVASLFELAERPSEKRVRELAEPWRPHRGSMAILMWHFVNSKVI